MNNLTFVGIDASLEISLFEYGLIISKEEYGDDSKTHFCIYKQLRLFGIAHISEKQVNDYVLGKEWIKKEDIRPFLDYVGIPKTDWIGLSLVQKLQHLINYWGTDNIIGIDHGPITEEEVRLRWLTKK